VLIPLAGPRSDRLGELGERRSDPCSPRSVDGEFIVAASEVLREGVSGDDDLRALARRAHPAAPPVLRHADLIVYTGRRVASRAGRLLDLSPKEFGVLEVLLAADGRAVPTEELLERVWDEAADPFTNAVKITISRLRAKLGEPPVIETVVKHGYRI
jgi:hypothetical protein